MACVCVTRNEAGVAARSVSSSEGGVASLPVNQIEGGVVFLGGSDTARLFVGPAEWAWPFLQYLSVPVREGLKTRGKGGVAYVRQSLQGRVL